MDYFAQTMGVIHDAAAGFSSERSRAIYWYVRSMKHQRVGPKWGCTRSNAGGHQIMFMVGGQGEGDYLGKRWTAKRGDAVLMDLHQPHSYYANPKALWEIYWVVFDGPGVAQVVDTLINAARSPVIPFSSERALKRDFSALFRLLKTRAPASDAWIYHHLTGLIANLEQGLQHRMQGKMVEEPSQPGIPAALALLRSEYGRTIGLPELARTACMSRFHFTRQFKRQTGFTAMEYLEKFRISRAQELILAHPAMALKLVADQVGYGDSAYFSRIFRRRTGMSPRAYRAERLR